MKELSIFIDESGDFGEYSFHSPYYIITMVFHDQAVDITKSIEHLDNELSYLGLSNLCIHTGPIIRKEEIYKNMDVVERRRIFNKMMAFIRSIDLHYKCFYIEKKHIEDSVEATGKLSKQISQFIREHYNDFLTFDDVKIYYDNGQIQVSRLLSSVFNALLQNPIFRKVMPSDYKLFQVADFICTMELIRLKIENNTFSNSEMTFFGNMRDLKQNYLKALKKKEW
ncbi:MAG: DUF3800 domain-containing protein [Treponema sp.]|uniref:DUF3800 domain-containing protein n=1 Tax=Treponema ruminis TaxID=744515 RepID=A0A7W8G6R9_9SPIR|nr:DUF3800 domain-containing protein [Treponema ruminis]MBB5224902.1 hypothetical protein [Treponema ruminis]MBR0098680.1 DUF3800 domain-containing protein [Treponema sp.]